MYVRENLHNGEGLLLTSKESNLWLTKGYGELVNCEDVSSTSREQIITYIWR